MLNVKFNCKITQNNKDKNNTDKREFDMQGVACIQQLVEVALSWGFFSLVYIEYTHTHIRASVFLLSVGYYSPLPSPLTLSNTSSFLT